MQLVNRFLVTMTRSKLLIQIVAMLLAVTSVSGCKSDVSVTSSLDSLGVVDTKFENLLVMYPTWAPSGEEIAFVDIRTGSHADEAGYLSILDVSTGTSRKLTNNNEARYTRPKWSPHGNLIATERYFSIWLLSVSDGQERYLAAGEGVAWSPVLPKTK